MRSPFLNDHFGNAVAPGTAVNFTTNGASVFGQVPTDSAGRASTTLISEGGVPDNGIITVLATTRGEESFIDSNGNGNHDANEQFTDVAEPLIDFNANGRFDPPEAFTDQNGNQRFDEGEPYTDSNANGRYDAHANERFIDVNNNDVWDAAQSPGVWDGNAVISTSADITFSAHTQALLLPPSFVIEDGGSQAFTLTVSDLDLNPLVGGSTISVQLEGSGAEDADILGIPGTFTLPDRGWRGAGAQTRQPRGRRRARADRPPRTTWRSTSASTPTAPPVRQRSGVHRRSVSCRRRPAPVAPT
jgi:hypothetical protein